jgi:DNA-binding NarL/FixJ family response regulator
MQSPAVLIVEDHPMMVNALRASMQEVLPQAKFFHANSQAQGLALLEQYDDFSLVLLDLNLPDSQGVATLNAFCQARPSGALMVFSMVDDPAVEAMCLANQVTYLHKSEPVSRLLDMVLQTLQTAVAFPDLPSATVLSARETPVMAMQTLSPRQLHVLAELARGKSSREIAQHFGVEESTVRTHQNVIYQRLGVKNKTQASAIYWQWSHSLGMDHG